MDGKYWPPASPHSPGPHWHHAEGQLVSTPATLSRALPRTPYPVPRTPAPPGTSEAWQGRGIRASPGLWCCQGALPFMRLNATATQAPPRRDQSLASARCPGFPSVTFEESRRYEHHGERKAERLNRSSVCGNIPSRSPSQPIT